MGTVIAEECVYMKLIACLAAVALVPTVVMVSAARAASEDASFKTFLPRFEQGLTDFINGDPTLWKQNVSQRDESIIIGGWGAFEKGWNDISARYDWAAARFRNSGAKVAPEYLVTVVSGDTAYTVTIERSVVLLVGQDKPAPMALRVTHIFRKDPNDWKLVLRHADPLMEKAAPATVLQK
jgi:ketosteroid isomerase-like protein